MVIFFTWPRSALICTFQADAEIFSDGLATGEDRVSLLQCSAAIAEARSLEAANSACHAAVDDQIAKRLHRRRLPR